jgi:hypothetical protein
MRGKIKYLLVLLMAMIVAGASGQNSQTMYYMNIPQNHLMNPAMRPSNSFYIGLPVISGTNVNISNNFVNFSDVFMKSPTSDSVITFMHPDYNIDKFIAKIKDKNSISPQAMVQLFGMGFSAGKDGYVFLDINERLEGNLVLPGDLFRLAFKGNQQFVGSTIDLSAFRGDLKYYREFGLGFSKDFTGKLRLGVKAKLLTGIGSVSIDNRALGITVNNDYTHTLDADLAVNLSGPFILSKDSKNKIESIKIDDSRINTGRKGIDYLFAPRNVGLGLDLGATYDISDKIMISAAITDIGFIKWKRDVINIQAKSQFQFSGLNMSDVINGTKTFDELGKEMLDSLKNSFVVSDSKNPYTTWLPVGVTIGGSFIVSRSFSLGLLSYSRIIGKQIREAFTLSGNLNLRNAFSTSVSYTITNNSYDNLGFGLAFRPGIVQFYFIADRIPLSFNKITDFPVPLPSGWNVVNMRLGMNFVFGNKVKKKDDKPMVLVE